MFNNLKQNISSNTGLLIRLDDIAANMNWHLMEKCEKLFDKYNIKPLLGVVSNNKDPELLSNQKKDNFWDQIRKWHNKNWEIAMHGYTHIYDTETNKKDYFNYGGKSEFFGHSYEIQSSRIKKSLEIFNNEKIKVRSFFAPNHTYDHNTFAALRDNNISNIIDGYGIMPYKKDNLNFFPQLFYKQIMLPFGIQSTQIHLNYWNDKDFEKFENFIIKNSSKIISFDQALSKVNNSLFYTSINLTIEKLLKIMRMF